MAFYIKDSHGMIGCRLKIKNVIAKLNGYFSVKINTIFPKIFFNLIFKVYKFSLIVQYNILVFIDWPFRRIFSNLTTGGGGVSFNLPKCCIDYTTVLEIFLNLDHISTNYFFQSVITIRALKSKIPVPVFQF